MWCFCVRLFAMLNPILRALFSIDARCVRARCWISSGVIDCRATAFHCLLTGPGFAHRAVTSCTLESGSPADNCCTTACCVPGRHYVPRSVVPLRCAAGVTHFHRFMRPVPLAPLWIRPSRTVVLPGFSFLCADTLTLSYMTRFFAARRPVVL